MADRTAVHDLVARVVYNRGYDGLDGLDPIRRMLWKDDDGSVAACLEQEMVEAPDKVRAGIAFLLGARYLEIGRLDAIRALCSTGDHEVASAALGCLTGETKASQAMGPEAVELALEGASHPAPSVRAAACSVLMNQCAWGVDVSSAVVPMLGLLRDTDAAVRQGAAYAVGHFARSPRYDLAPHIELLAGSLNDPNIHMRTASTWALWKLSGRRDITGAVSGLVKVLESPDDYNGPRKNAAGTLLCFARISPDNRALVKRLTAAARLDTAKKEISRFLHQLSV